MTTVQRGVACLYRGSDQAFSSFKWGECGDEDLGCDFLNGLFQRNRNQHLLQLLLEKDEIHVFVLRETSDNDLHNEMP